MMEQKKKGILRRYNKSEGKMPGIQLDDGRWYNATERTQSFVEGLKGKEGAEVELFHENGTINFIRLTKEPSESNTDNTSTKKKDGASTGMAINNANNLIIQKNIEFHSEKEWAQLVVSYAKALMDEMERQGLN